MADGETSGADEDDLAEDEAVFWLKYAKAWQHLTGASDAARDEHFYRCYGRDRPIDIGALEERIQFPKRTTVVPSTGAEVIPLKPKH